jgi:hypothetical protein
MICPSCGYDNISGSDVCEECQQSLTLQVQVASVAPTILNQRLSLLNPRQPECVGRKTTVAETIEVLKGKNVGCVMVIGEAGELIFPRKSGHAQAASLVECSSNAAGVA